MAKQKTKAAAFVCQSKEQAMDSIRALGDAQRELTRIETEINDLIAEATASRKEQINALKVQVETLTAGIHTWCEAHRAELCADGRKTANLITGEVSWRQRPPSVSIRAVDKVMDTLRALGLDRFIRSKDEPNKEAMLSDPTAVSGIAGISIVTGVEDFIVQPFEVEVVTGV
ncbi:phage host-nuclease inhibitor protein Gam [Microvirgula sp. AG722]|uniref:host-nuclease inhibitor Gam family protein n=1 Tax=Microvirgula sp. AG722 TaxID=2183901 RepID=UPI000DC3D5DB|nr:host-nuclease inhibitor Gam family protein [Microvirgula sp. AG722]RAS18905.1 phage host-nuclease inhibitor protein Gam [Microvirgula sp. AG722]